jgi:hypothetical protein
MTMSPLTFPRVHLTLHTTPQGPILACPLERTPVSLSVVRANTSVSPNALILRKETLRPPPPPVLVGMGIGTNFLAVFTFWDLVMGASGLLGAGAGLFAVSTVTGLLWNLPGRVRHEIALLIQNGQTHAAP